jgi:hypothetical protein
MATNFCNFRCAAAFARSMMDYGDGVLKHICDFSKHKMPTLEEFMAARRGGVGVTPVITLIE